MPKPYFGTHEPLPESRTLRAGALSCLYEQGTLRYISAQGHELLRMIYAALRDEHWRTVPFTIHNEVIRQEEDAFLITYTARYALGTLRYEGTFRLEGTSEGTITVTMQGTAQSTFQRNRIGLCVLHPIQGCAGQPVLISTPEGERYEGTFPESISPHQPFQNIAGMRWVDASDAVLTLDFGGDVFETEDQRNWTDHSYKTYSTPQHRPRPVLVQPGDTVEQWVTLQLIHAPTRYQEEVSRVDAPRVDTPGVDTPGVDTPGVDTPGVDAPGVDAPRLLMPCLGYARNATYGPLTEQDVVLLRQVPFAHYRVEVALSQPDWKADWAAAQAEAQQLGTSVELVAWVGHDLRQELPPLLGTLADSPVRVRSLLVLPRQVPWSASWFAEVAALVRQQGVEVPLGYGTDGYFAELNRNRPPEAPGYDFVSFSVNPQVHAFDTRTLIENVSAQRYAVETARQFLPPGVPIHVSPVTFRIRNYPAGPESTLPPDQDPRHTTELGAAWMLLSLKYLAGAQRLTYFETTGPKGIIPGAPSTSPSPETYPLHRYLARIRAFDPSWILDLRVPEPFVWDVLGLENARGEQLYFMVNFSTEPRQVTLPGLAGAHFLAAESIHEWFVANNPDEPEKIG
ncbi:hypothetical protein GCM10027275_43720 [Rhabdobacter roseus]|uniref:Uncharacterized protein n=1 Tax=Rhabdobacter roseus TaxID=1655419 RepID=A0A840TY83_9BACT|nr:hypothetical protein [Rhabdobacter roseus]MBB5286572.1 hypothetical protein [Rhabdobacter roseus]